MKKINAAYLSNLKKLSKNNCWKHKLHLQQLPGGQGLWVHLHSSLQLRQSMCPSRRVCSMEESPLLPLVCSLVVKFKRTYCCCLVGCEVLENVFLFLVVWRINICWVYVDAWLNYFQFACKLLYAEYIYIYYSHFNYNYHDYKK